MTRTYCDHCGAEILGQYVTIRIEASNEYYCEGPWDLCRQCAECFKDMTREWRMDITRAYANVITTKRAIQLKGAEED